MELIFFVVTLGLMYLLLIRPQQQRVRRHRELVTDLRVGDRVVTIGGMIGEIVSIYEDEVTVEVAPDTRVKFLRVAITQVLRENLPSSSENVDGEDGT